MSVTDDFITAGFEGLDQSTDRQGFLDMWYETLIFQGSAASACAILGAMLRNKRFENLVSRAEVKFGDHTIGDHMRTQVRNQYSASRSEQQKQFHAAQREKRRQQTLIQRRRAQAGF